MTELDRRTVLRGVAVTGAIGTVGGLLSSCGSDDESGSDSAGSDTSPEPDGSGSPEGSDGGGGDVLASKADIPVGGGKVFGDQQVVVTQPSQGEFLAFTSVCTHQGCTVGDVSDGTINCQCHGSAFNIDDGSVANGPATAALEEKQINVEGEEITLA